MDMSSTTAISCPTARMPAVIWDAHGGISLTSLSFTPGSVRRFIRQVFITGEKPKPRNIRVKRSYLLQ